MQPNSNDPYYYLGPDFYSNQTIDYGAMEEIGGFQTNDPTAEDFHSEFQPSYHMINSESEWLRAIEDWPPGPSGSTSGPSEPVAGPSDLIASTDLPTQPVLAAPRPFTSVVVDGVLDEDFIKYLESLQAPSLKFYVMDLSNVAWNFMFTQSVARMLTRSACEELITETCERQLSIDPAAWQLERGAHVMCILFFSFLIKMLSFPVEIEGWRYRIDRRPKTAEKISVPSTFTEKGFSDILCNIVGYFTVFSIQQD